MSIFSRTTWFGSDARPLEEQRTRPNAVSGADVARKRNHEKGGSRLKLVIWLVILGVIINAAVLLVPALVNEFEFQNNIQDIARFASVNRSTAEHIRKEVLDEADRNNLPVQPSDVKVKVNGGNIQIDVDYSVTIDLKVYQWTLNFHPSATNNSIT